MERWVKHFEELLNRLPSAILTDIQPATDVLPMKLNPPTKEEIKKAIMSLRNGRAAGPDTIPSEALKLDIRTSIEVLRIHPCSEKSGRRKGATGLEQGHPTDCFGRISVRTEDL